MGKFDGSTFARTRSKALKNVRKAAKKQGKTATKIKMSKAGGARVKGKQVWHFDATTRIRRRK